MQLTINLSNTLTTKKVSHIIRIIEDAFTKEGVTADIKENISQKNDAWENLDVNTISVDTGIEDFAENHDHYLYGLPKHS